MPSKSRKRKNETSRRTRPACPRSNMDAAGKRDAGDEKNTKLKVQAFATRKDITEFSNQVKRPEFAEIVLTHYLTPYLVHKEFKQRPSITSEARDIIFSVIGRLKKFIIDVGHPMFRNGKLSACGSVPEYTKVGQHDEFDYQYLIKIGSYTSTRKVHPRTRPRHGSTSSKLGTRSYYELKTISDNGDEVVLNPEATQDLFMDNICRAVSKCNIEYTVKKAGPAVKLVFAHPQIEYTVRIDLTLGIEAEVLDVFKECELTPVGVELLHMSELQCHFVSSTDYWKICFLRTEQAIMQGLHLSQDSIEKHLCYKIIKSLRDELDVKDLYGDGILQSYPLKVTFLDLVLTDEKEGREWTRQDIGSNVNRILREVESRGQRHEICSLFIKDEEVMGESDRSYLESTRILNELARLHDTYLQEKSVLPYTCMLLIGVIAFVVHMLEYMNVQLNSPLDLSNLPLSNQRCDVKANLHRYTNSSNLWDDISHGAYNLTFLLFILETLCSVVYIFRWVNERSKIKGLNDLAPNGIHFNTLLAIQHIYSVVFFMKLSYRNEAGIEFYARKLRHAMYLLQMTTVFPALHALMRLSMKAFISIQLPYINTLIIMESFFQQGKIGSNYLDDIKGYIAEVPCIHGKHCKKYFYLAIHFSSVSLLVIMPFLYTYFWSEEDDESFLFERSRNFAKELILLTFMDQHLNFLAVFIWFVLPFLTQRFLHFSLPESVLYFLHLPLTIVLLTLQFDKSIYINISFYLLSVALCHIYLQADKEYSLLGYRISLTWKKYHWLMSSCIILCYYLMWGANYHIALFAYYLKSNHLFIALYMIYLIALVSLATCISFGLSLWMCSRYKAFWNYTVRLLGTKMQQYVDWLKSNAFNVFLLAVLVYNLYSLYMF